MPTFADSYAGIVAALAERFGSPEAAAGQGAEDPFARMVAVQLGRTLEARKVGRALDALRESGLLEPETLAKVDPGELAEAARIGGATLPAAALRAIQRLGRWLVDRHKGSAGALHEVSTDRLREELISVNGIGAATADAILLFALGRPVYPIDRASYRILVRHGWIDPTADYDEAQDLVAQQSPDDPVVLARLSAWLERVGREACRTSVAKCERCPLKPFLPAGGPREPE
jgi:endonuclease III related protein